MALSVSALDDLSKFLLLLVGSGGGLGTFLYWLLKSKLEDRFTRELERTRHQLQLEQQKMSIVYEHQKDSFRKVLLAMHFLGKAHKGQYDSNGIPERAIEEFQKVVIEEALFLEAGSNEAVQLFVHIARQAETGQDQSPEINDVVRARAEMNYVTERLAAHFRKRIGLDADDSDSIADLQVLGALYLLNEVHPTMFALPDESPLQFRYGLSVRTMVILAKQNNELLLAELTRCRAAVSGQRLHPSVLENVDRYLREINQWKNSRQDSSGLPATNADVWLARPLRRPQ
jgi:hypothetical protein